MTRLNGPRFYFLIVAREGGNTDNKQSQLATQNLLHDKLQENVAHITRPLSWYKGVYIK